MATAIYARKSSESEDRQVQSLDDQVRVLEEFANRQGILVSEVIIEARSAKSPGTRPEFERLMRKVQDGQVTGILTWAINRLSRNLVDGGLVAHLLQTGKLEYIKTPQRDYLPEDNVLIMSIENGMATGFVQDLSRNVRRGMQGKCDRGWYPGAAPVGYKNDLATHEIIRDPVKFELVKHAWKLLLGGGMTVMDIHREMVRLGLTASQRGNSGSPIGKSQVYNIFSRRFYTGEFDYKGVRYRGNHEPMITSSEFEMAQVLLGRAPKAKQHKHQLPFAGVIKCGVCGCSVVGEVKRKSYRTTGNEATYTYYHCSGARGCSKRSVSEQAIWAALDKVQASLSFDPDFVEWCEESLRKNTQGDLIAVDESGVHLQNRVKAAEARLHKLNLMRLDGEVGQSEYLSLKSECTANLDSLRERAERSRSMSEHINTYIANRLGAAKQLGKLREATALGARAIVQGIGSNHTLTLGKLHFELDPVIAKIAGFEPLNSKSERAKPCDQLGQILIWQGLLEELRKIAYLQLSSQFDSVAQSAQNSRHEKQPGRLEL